MTPNEEIKLCVKYQQGCNASLERLLVRYDKYLKSRVQKLIHRHGQDYFDDLYQESCMAFMKGCIAFKPELGQPLRTYITYWVDTRIKRFQSRDFKTPQTMLDKEISYYNVNKMILLGMPLEEALQKCRIDKNLYTRMKEFYSVRYDSEYKGLDGKTFLITDRIEDPDECPLELAQRNNLKESLHKLLSDLPDKEREILKHRYEIEDYPLLTWAELASKYDMKHRTIQLHKQKAEQKMQEVVNQNP